MLHLLLRVLAGLLVLAAAIVALSAAASAMTHPPQRGRMIDMDQGRRMRLVCEGQAGAHPTVWFESGAFGFAADWGSVQSRLVAKGYRACAYDRAGLGFSDKGPAPRDADAIAGDLEKLIVASGEKGPFIFVGHSAAGLYLRRFWGLQPERFTGLVLVDAMTPESTQSRLDSGFFGNFRRLTGWAAAGATVGLFKPLAFTTVPDRIGLVGPVKAEKRRVFASGRHNRGAAAEVKAWPGAVAQGVASAPYDPNLPLAVVLAGPSDSERAAFNSQRAAPARAAKRGRVENVDGANHASLLGEYWADRIVDAVLFVDTPAPTPQAGPPASP